MKWNDLVAGLKHYSSHDDYEEANHEHAGYLFTFKVVDYGDGSVTLSLQYPRLSLPGDGIWIVLEHCEHRPILWFAGEGGLISPDERAARKEGFDAARQSVLDRMHKIVSAFPDEFGFEKE